MPPTNIQRNPKYLAPIRTVPNTELSNSATGSIVIDNSAAGNVRLFHRDGNDWIYVSTNHTFTARDLKKGLILGIDARQTRTPGGWDGRATLEFSIKDGQNVAKDRVELRVAPVLTHHHGQRVQQVFATAGDGSGSTQDKFVRDLTEISARADIKNPLFVVNTTDIWTQDFFEPGYMSIPGPDGAVTLHIMIRSAQERRISGRVVFRDFRSNTVGAVQAHGDGCTTDSTGNQETIPPYTLNGKSYPAGRTIMGSQGGLKPLITKFLEAQELQAPLVIDTTWLKVGHIDEFLQFVPVKNRLGWAMMIADPIAGLDLLLKAQKAGYGHVRALSRPSLPNDDKHSCLPTDTIDEILNKVNFIKIQEYCAKNIQASIDILKREIGITDNEIIHVPSLFAENRHTFKCNTTSGGDSDDAKIVQYGQDQFVSILDAAGGQKTPRITRCPVYHVPHVSALYPGTINGLVLSDSQYIAPNPWGPVIDGKDILAAAVSAAYSEANYSVTYMDDWFSHHVGLGEVHCGSNTVRDASTKWWQSQ